MRHHTSITFVTRAVAKLPNSKEIVVGCSRGQFESSHLHVLGEQVRAGEHLWGCGACDFDLCEGCRAKAEDTITSLMELSAMYAFQIIAK